MNLNYVYEDDKDTEPKFPENDETLEWWKDQVDSLMEDNIELEKAIDTLIDIIKRRKSGKVY